MNTLLCNCANTVIPQDEEEDNKSNSMGAKMVNVDYHEHSKKTKAKARKVKLQTAAAKKAVRIHDKKQEEAVPLFPAIQVSAECAGHDYYLYTINTHVD